MVAAEIEKAGGVAKEFNTIAVDDGIAMGHGGMLYSYQLETVPYASYNTRRHAYRIM